MILVRSPLRITLGGGGTDLPWYASRFGGACLTAAIQQYVYVSAIKPFTPGIYLKYSEIEHVDDVTLVTHPLFKAALEQFPWLSHQIELTTLADIPAGTGLGSSSSFLTALLHALAVMSHVVPCPSALAQRAHRLEGDLIGAQDAYAAAYGGVQWIETSINGSVTATPVKMSDDTRELLQDRLLLVATGRIRESASILARQALAADEGLMHQIKAIGHRSKLALENGECGHIGHDFHEHWMLKRGTAEGMSHHTIDAWYQLARDNGAIGGKLVGAGGGGFLLLYCEDKARVTKAMRAEGLRVLPVQFALEGTKVLLS